MKHINEDVPAFFEEGGWEFLFPEEAAVEEESEDGSDFHMSEDSDEGSTEYSDDSESDFSGSSDSENSEVGTPSESEGEDWSDLEEKAAKGISFFTFFHSKETFESDRCFLWGFLSIRSRSQPPRSCG